MILPGSYANGFAPRDGQPLYPSLWRGCDLALAPCLGPTGLTIRDWSGRGQNAAINAASMWGVNQRSMVALNGTSQFIDPGVKNYGNTDITIVLWLRARVQNNQYIVSGWSEGAGPGVQFTISVGSTDKLNMFSAASFVRISSTTTITDNVWRCVSFEDSGTSMTIRVNGKIEATGNAGAVTYNNWRRFIGVDGNILGFANADIADARFYLRTLSSAEHNVLASRPGIAYDLAPRRRASLVAGFNRRRRLLVGAGS